MPVRLARWLLPLLALAASAAAREEFFDRVGTLEPFPREVARGRKLVLEGRLKGAYRSPELILIAPDGRTYLNRDQEITPAGFTFRVRFERGPGPYRLELVASSATRIRSVARFTVWYGRRRPKNEVDEFTVQYPEDPPELHPRLLEKRLAGMLNALRAKVGLGPLGWNEAVAARAREHAARMAKARRTVHRFGGVGGVRDLLGRDGAGPGGLSGPARSWPGLTNERPFPPFAPQPFGPRVRNHVVVFVGEHNSLEEWFERKFVREAAWRLCALDPHGVELAVGAARPPPRTLRKGKRTEIVPARDVYYCVCFVQVNDKALIRGQDEAFRDLLRRAAGREPDVLRHLGIWGRQNGARALLEGALAAPDPAVSSAALDGLLLLDEKSARKRLAKAAAKSRALVARHRYAEAARAFDAYAQVAFDPGIARRPAEAAQRADAAAGLELERVRTLEEPQRSRALRDLARRAAGLPVEAAIRRELG